MGGLIGGEAAAVTALETEGAGLGPSGRLFARSTYARPRRVVPKQQEHQVFGIEESARRGWAAKQSDGPLLRP